MYNLKDKKKQDYFKKIVVGHSTKEIIELYYQKFGEKMSKMKVEDLKKRFNLRSFDGKYTPRPIGSERLTERGRIKIKVAEPDVWKLKHIYIYEQKYGKIPKGKVLVFLDGNKQNCSLDNLKLVDKKEQLLMARMDLYSKNTELTKAGILLAELINKNNKIKNK